MKFLTVFVALMSVAHGYQVEWTLHQLDQAISNPATHPSLLPYLEQALNEMMASLFAGQHVTSVTITTPALDLSTWTLPQLSAAIQNPNTDPNLLPYMEQALNQIMESMMTEVPITVAPVVVPAMSVSIWTLQELNVALGDPTTNPALVPYLEQALNEIMDALFSGSPILSAVVVIPVDLLEAQSPVEAVPVVPITPVETPVVPIESTPAPPAPAGALVQIIINVNGKGAPSPVAAPEKPESVIIVDEAAPQEPAVNPVDIIAVAAPEVNPVDLLHPIPGVLPVAAGGDVVGPIV